MRASRDRNTPRSTSATAAASPVCARRPDRSATATITRCARVSSRRWNASCWTGVGSGPTPRHAWPSSSSSRDGTIPAGGTRPSAICHLSTTKGASYPPLAQIHNRPRNRGNSRLPLVQHRTSPWRDRDAHPGRHASQSNPERAGAARADPSSRLDPSSRTLRSRDPTTGSPSPSRLDQPTCDTHNRRNCSVNRNRHCLKVVDGFRSLIDSLPSSLRSSNSRWRDIAPHAIAFDGHRWHARAWCCEREEFRDLVLTRIERLGRLKHVAFEPEHDLQWSETVRLRLCPHPGLSEEQSQAIQRDYDGRGARQPGVLSPAAIPGCRAEFCVATRQCQAMRWCRIVRRLPLVGSLRRMKRSRVTV